MAIWDAILFPEMLDKPDFARHDEVCFSGWCIFLDGVVDIHGFDKHRRVLVLDAGGQDAKEYRYRG